MERRDCDALVLFGATGDLCFKKIYPALYHLVRRGLLTIPVIGVARQGCDVKWLAARVRDSVKASVKDPDEAVTTRLTGAAALRRRRLQRPQHLRGAEAGARANPSGRCSTWRSRRACSRWWSST